jgi:hypothetical protein
MQVSAFRKAQRSFGTSPAILFLCVTTRRWYTEVHDVLLISAVPAHEMATIECLPEMTMNQLKGTFHDR